MSPAVDLTGRWVGHYRQHEHERPISAELLQQGQRFSGTMCDGQPQSEFTLFEMAQQAGLPPGADELIEAKLREDLPDARKGPIRYAAHLPANSILDGHWKGRVVYFRKTYQGSSFSGYKLGDKLVGVQRKGHAVHYEGELSPDGRLIEGRWWIDADAASGTYRADGTFVLRREGRD